ARRTPVSLGLAAGGMALAVTIGLPLGIVLGTTRRRIVARAISTYASAVVSIPAFLIGIFILAGAYWLAGRPDTVGAYSFIMATSSLGIHISGYLVFSTSELYARFVRAEFVGLARSKGLGGVRVHG